jgi:hypothetical protein
MNILDTVLQEIQGAVVSGDLKVAAISQLSRMITGEPPIITEYPGYTQVSFSIVQQKKLELYFEDMIFGAPGSFRVDLKPVFYPIVLKRLIPIVAAVAVIGYVAGRKSK